MALQKTHVLPNSTTATYWKITALVVNLISKDADVTLTGYVDLAARQNNVSAGLMKKTVSITLDDVDTNLIEQAYAKVKTTPENAMSNIVFFDGAIDL